MSNVKKIGLFGFGTVAKGFYQILCQQRDLQVRIEKVCIKRPNLDRNGYKLHFTDQAQEILEDDTIEIVIEVTDDATLAKEIVKRALERGKSAISANKRMIAESLHEVNQWHQAYDSPFLYEAAVGGGIPIIYTIDHSLKDYRITKIRAILNGSSNYILSQMHQQNYSFDQALDQAQQKGFAESDPRLDIEGWDASFKLAILAYHSFDEILLPDSFLRESIQNISPLDIQQAHQLGQKIKSIASVEKKKGKLHCHVKAEWLQSTDELYNVDNENNAISLETELSNTHTLIGKGAGSLPTGSAIFSDLKRILNGYKYR